MHARLYIELTQKKSFLGNKLGEGRIRTFEGVSRQIYSLLHLATLEPHQKYLTLHFGNITLCLAPLILGNPKHRGPAGAHPARERVTNPKPTTELESVTSSLPRKCSTS